MRRAARVGHGVWLWLCLCLLLPLQIFGFAQSHDERAVRAAYVFNLTKYVEWPAEVHDLGICVIGDHATAETFSKMLEGRASDTHTIHVLKSVEPDRHCNVLYFAGSAPTRSGPGGEKLGADNVLTVGEADTFASGGGMVGLVRTGDQIQIEVNVLSAQRAGIKISSRLLSLARVVKPEPSGRAGEAR